MPNWCTNKIVITGDKSKIKEILEKIGTIPVDTKTVLFETLIGRDPEIDRIGWHESNLKRFGTKWDVAPQGCEIEFSDDTITMNPKTASSPPIPFCVALAQEYDVEVDITYFERLSDYAGRNLIFSTGDVIEEEDYDYTEGMYHLDNKKFWEDRANDDLEEMDLDIKDVDTYVSETFPYLCEDGQRKLVGIYKQILVN